MKKGRDPAEVPSIEEIRDELKREQYKVNYNKMLKSTIYTLLVIVAVLVVAALLVFPVMRIEGNSMEGTLCEGDVVVVLKTREYKAGDVVAFYHNNDILIKRVVAVAGDWVDMDEEGNVYVNQEPLEEPYLTAKALGDCGVPLPLQVPEGRSFVLGDNREVTLDSRNPLLGCVGDDLVIGRILFRIWPLSEFGRIG